MKHVGLNVAADPLFTAAYTGTSGPLVIVSATIRAWHPARMSRITAALPWPRPCRCSNRPTPRSRTISRCWLWNYPPAGTCQSSCEPPRESAIEDRGLPSFAGKERHRRISSATFARVMIPSNARPAHRRLRQKLGTCQWNEEHGPNELVSRAKSAGNRHFRCQLSCTFAKPRRRPPC